MNAEHSLHKVTLRHDEWLEYMRSIGATVIEPSDEPIKPDEVLHDRHWYSTRQRIIVATFQTIEHAETFDRYVDAGLRRPGFVLDVLESDLAIVNEP